MGKIPKPSIDSPNKRKLTKPNVESKKPVISFKYMKGSPYNFDYLLKMHNKNKGKKYFLELQEFCFDFESCSEINGAIKSYTSKKGSKISAKDNSNVKKMLISFNHCIGSRTNSVQSEVIHLHSKKCGKGKFVMYGVVLENIFYIIGLDPEHEFLN